MAYRHLFCAVLFSLISLAASAQQVVKANKIIAKDSLHLSGKTVAEIFENSNFATATHKDLPTALAVKNYFEANAIDSISIVSDSILILYAAGSEITRDTLPPGITQAEVAQMISDSLSTIPPSNLSYDAANREIDISSGGTSATIPLAVDDGATEGLASFTAADFNVISGNVSIDYINGQAASGSNNGFLSSTNWTTFNSKIGGSGTTNQIPIFTGSGTIGNSSRLSEVSGYIFRVGGFYNSNPTGLDIWADGANPYITQRNDNNSSLIIRTNGGSLTLSRRSDNANTLWLSRTSSNLLSSLWVGTNTGTPAARLHTTGSGSTSATFSFLAENSSGTDHFQVRDDGGVFVPVRSGTATNLAGWTSDHRATNTNVSSRLSLTSGTLDINTDSIPTYNIFTKNSSFTANRTGTISEDNYLLFTSTNSESGLPYKCYFGTVEDDIYTGDFVFGRYSLTGDAGNYLMDFDGYSYDQGGNAKYWAAYDGSSNSSLTYSASNFQVLVNTSGGLCKIRATDSGIAILEGENGIEFKSGPVTDMMTLHTDAARLESSLVLVNDAADLAEDGQIWKEENRLNFNTANLSTALSGVMFTGTTDATVANTTTETTLIPSGEGTVTIPANYLKAGKTITVEAWGIYTADASPSTLEIKASLGGVLLCTTGSNTMTTSEGGQWHTTITFTCRTTGATGTVMSQGETRFNHAVGAGTTYWMRRSATNTVNTTGSLAFNLTGQHGAADPDNSITLTNIKITVEN